MPKNSIVLQSKSIKQMIGGSKNVEFSLVGSLESNFIIMVSIDEKSYIVSTIIEAKPKTYKQIDRAIAYIVEEFCVNTITLKVEGK